MRQIYNYAWCFLNLFVCACGDSTTQRDDAYNLDEEALTQLAGEAFTFAYPLMEQYRMLLGLTNPQSPAFAAELNELDVIRALSGPESTQVIRPNADTLTIYLQHENPGADKERNWLPTNDGPFTLTMRMYIPEDTSYQPPALFTPH